MMTKISVPDILTKLQAECPAASFFNQTEVLTMIQVTLAFFKAPIPITGGMHISYPELAHCKGKRMFILGVRGGSADSTARAFPITNPELCIGGYTNGNCPELSEDYKWIKLGASKLTVSRSELAFSSIGSE